MDCRRLLRLAFLALLPLAGSARAGCGLSFCPRLEPPGGPALELGFMAREAGFDLHGVEGRYTELMASAQATFLGRLAVGLHAPVVVLHLEDATEAGLGNAIVYGEWRLRPAFLMALSLGMQLEIPTGAADHGLADDHFMIAPYASFAKPVGRMMLGAALGTAATLHGDHGESGGHHHHGTEAGPTPVFVHPHEEWEALYRLSAGLVLLGGRFLPEAFLDGQHVLSDPGDAGAPIHFLAAGLTLPWTLGESLVVSPNASLPVLPDSRFEWSVGISLGWKPGFRRPPPAPGEA